MGTRKACKWLAAVAGLVSALTIAPVGALPLFEITPGDNANPVGVHEYYNARTDHYFVTGATAEIALLETLTTGEWQRMSDAPAFMAFASAVTVLHADSGNREAQPVCRFFIPPASHFLSASKAECDVVAATYPAFVLESTNAFYAWLPDPADGSCPQLSMKVGNFDFAPVYRLWNARADTNHRLTTSRNERAAMIEQGWVPEGYGPDGVAMCVPNWTN
jgi:hypothetical protein